MKDQMILMISNMYPSADNPQYGVFIENIEKGLKANGLKIETIKMTKKSGAFKKMFAYVFFYFSIIRSLMSTPYAGVYVHYLSHCGAPVLLACLFKKINILSNAHGGDLLQEEAVSNWKFSLKKMVNRRLLNKSRLVVVPSQYYKDEVVVRQYKIKKEKVFVSPSGGIDENIFKEPVSGAIRSKSQMRLLYVGRITEDKGIFDFLSTLGNIKNKSIIIDIIGHGEKHMLERLGRHIKIFDNSNITISYHGSIRHNALPRFYQQANAFVFPSKRFSESLGLVGLEAMACGTPVIGSDIAGISSYLRNGYNGLSFNPHESGGFQEALDKFMRMEAEERKNMEKNALLTAQDYGSAKVSAELSKKIKEELPLS